MLWYDEEKKGINSLSQLLLYIQVIYFHKVSYFSKHFKQNSVESIFMLVSKIHHYVVGHIYKLQITFHKLFYLKFSTLNTLAIGGAKIKTPR